MQIAIVAGGFTPARPTGCAAPWRPSSAPARSARSATSSSTAWSAAATSASSPSAASTRSRASANTAFPKATPRASRCSSMPRAWIKCHYPDVFCAALLNSQPMGFYAPAQIVRDAQRAWRRGARRRRQFFRLGLHAGATARKPARGCIDAPCRHARRHPHHPRGAARLPPDQRPFGGRRAQLIVEARAAAASTRSATCGCAPACRPPCSSGSPMPTPSARSASTAAMRCGRCARCSAPATRTTCRCSPRRHRRELRARCRAAADAAGRAGGRGLSLPAVCR